MTQALKDFVRDMTAIFCWERYVGVGVYKDPAASVWEFVSPVRILAVCVLSSHMLPSTDNRPLQQIVSQNSITSLNSYTVGENPVTETKSNKTNKKKLFGVKKKTAVKVSETSAINHNSTQLLYVQDVKVVVYVRIKIWVTRNKFFMNEFNVFPNTLKTREIFCISLKEDTCD